ncbi:MAG: DciA family protein [Deltaproteobacteria bacterium]
MAVPKQSSVERISSPLETLMQRLKGGAKDPEQALRDALTEKEAPHARFCSMNKGVLRMAVDSSAWLYYFNLRKGQLTAKIAERLPELTKLVFIIGEIRPKKVAKKGET